MKYKVNVAYLIAQDTVESILVKAIIRKQKNFNALLDRDEDRQEFAILNTVMRKLTKKTKKQSPFPGEMGAYWEAPIAPARENSQFQEKMCPKDKKFKKILNYTLCAGK